MKKLRILVDIDDVINNLLDCWVALLNKKHDLNANAQDLKEWNVQAIYPSLTIEEVYRPMYENEIWKTIAPRPTSVKYMKKMIDDGHDVVIVTASVYQTLPAKMDWLFSTFPFLSWDNVIIARRKQLIKADVLIDDGIHNLEGGKFFKILMDSPNNRHYDTNKNGMIRVHTIKEAYEAINKYLVTRG